jgi:acetylornithine/succinyldiaminopimelate/putrescine aminotransferase
MTVNPVFHARSKHIELHYHFVRERVALGLLITQHISTHEQIADIFTKPMSKGALAYFKDKLCLRLRPSWREDVNGNKTDAYENNSTAAVSQQRGKQHGNESALMETNQL